MSRLIFAAVALMLAGSPVLAEDELEVLAPVAPVAAAAAIDPAQVAVLQSMARQLAAQYRLTPEKKAALAAIARQQQASMAPHLKALENAANGIARDPQLNAALQRMLADMSGVLARQLPQVLAAVKPMVEQALPAMLEAQAKALRTLATPTPVDPFEAP